MSDELYKLLPPALVVIVLFLAGLIQSRKASPAPAAAPTTTAEVVAASFVDSRSLAEVTRALDNSREQSHDDSRKLRDSIDDLTSAVRRNTEAVESGAVTPRDMALLIARLDRTKGPGE